MLDLEPQSIVTSYGINRLRELAATFPIRGSKTRAGTRSALHRFELEYHLLLAEDLKRINSKNHAELSQRATACNARSPHCFKS